MNPEELDRLYRNELVHFASRLLGGDAHRAEDMVQEMLLRYTQQSATISTPRAWAYKVVQRCCLNELRGRNKLGPINEDKPDGEAEEPSDMLSQSELQRALEDCIRALAADQRSILQRRLDGQTQTRIAKDMGKSQADVSRLVNRANDSLKDCLHGKGFVE